MEGLVRGAIVEYVQDIPGIVSPAPERVSIVSKVHEVHHPENYPTGSIEAACDRYNDGDVTLHVLTENSVMVRYGVPYSAENKPGTWHWIERA